MSMDINTALDKQEQEGIHNRAGTFYMGHIDNFYMNSEKYLKETTIPKVILRNVIADKQEELRAHKDALPWE